MTRWGFDQFLRQDPWSLPWSPGHAISDGDETSPQAQYFLSELPDNTGGDSEDRRYCQKAPFLAARRYGVLQIQIPVYTEAEFEIVYGWHEHQWNRGDSVFIQSRQRAGQGDLGLCGLKFSISSVDVNRYLNYTLLVDGWTSDFRAEHPEPYDEDAPMSRFFQFTIVDINDFNPLDSRLPGQTDLEFEEKLYERIQRKGIPRTTQVVTEIPDKGMAAVLSVKYTRVEDKDVCCNPFRRLQFHFEVVKVEKAPTPVDWEWDSYSACDKLFSG